MAAQLLEPHLVLDFAGVVVDQEGVLELLRHLVELVVLVLLVELLKQRLVRGPRKAGNSAPLSLILYAQPKNLQIPIKP